MQAPAHGDRRQHTVTGTRIKGRVLYQPRTPPPGSAFATKQQMALPAERAKSASLSPRKPLAMFEPPTWTHRTGVRQTIWPDDPPRVDDGPKRHRLCHSAAGSRSAPLASSRLSSRPYYMYSPAHEMALLASPWLASEGSARATGTLRPPPDAFPPSPRRVRTPSASVLRETRSAGGGPPTRWSPLAAPETCPTHLGARLLWAGVAKGEADEQPLRPLTPAGLEGIDGRATVTGTSLRYK